MGEHPFQRVAICGPGLLGGSIALALRERMPGCELRLWARRAEPLAQARELGITQHTFEDVRAAVRGAELVILATPIGAFEELARRMMPALAKGCIITDIGSVKAYVHRTTGQLLTERGHVFIGSHPMAGAEVQGLANARASLINGATVAITNPHGAAEELVARLADFWTALGCKPYALDPVNHDRAVARISHMPHVLAGLAARNANSGDVPMDDLQRLAASGFRDTTRVCAGGTGMWTDILWENDVAVREVLAHCVEDLHALIALLEQQDKAGLRRWLDEAGASRALIRRERSR